MTNRSKFPVFLMQWIGIYQLAKANMKGSITGKIG